MIWGIICPRNTSHTTMPDVQTKLFQLLRHSRPAIAAQVETSLLLDVCQDNHVGPLPLTDWSASIGTQTASADFQHVTNALGAKRIAMFFGEPEPHGFGLAKKAVAFIGEMLHWGLS